MKIYNTDYITGVEFETIGLVMGSTIQSKNVFCDIGQGLKTLVGGELKSYSNMMAKARDIATQRMIEEAELLKADAIVNVKYTTSSVMSAAAEILAYGTAVKFK